MLYPCFRVFVCLSRSSLPQVFFSSFPLVSIPDNYRYCSLLQLLNFCLSFHGFLIVIKQCFLLQLINSAQAEKMTNISPSMMRIFQRGLLTQRSVFTLFCYIRWVIHGRRNLKILIMLQGQRGSKTNWEWFPVSGMEIINCLDFDTLKLLIFMHCTANRCTFSVNQLMDTNAQLWYIIREYISNSEVSSSDKIFRPLSILIPCSLYLREWDWVDFCRAMGIVSLPLCHPTLLFMLILINLESTIGGWSYRLCRKAARYAFFWSMLIMLGCY